jgi:hypothetical protein
VGGGGRAARRGRHGLGGGARRVVARGRRARGVRRDRRRGDAHRPAGGGRLDAFIDTFGGYIDLALELGVTPDRINTIIPPDRAAHPEVKSDGNAVGASAPVLAELAADIAAGRLEIPIARTYPLAEVREAYTELERRHTLGKIVLIP